MTNRELAKLLNVSPASLSLILNHKPGISEKTRNRVFRMLTDLGYSHLIKPQSPQETFKTICFVVYKRHGKILNQHPFFMLMMESIEAQSKKHQCNVLVTTIDGKQRQEEQVLSLNTMGVEGALVFATEMTESDIAYFSHLQIPWVAMDNDFSCLDINTVSINNQMGTYQAISHLAAMGHKEIGYLQSVDSISSFEERERGYRDAMARYRLFFEPRYCYRLRQSEEGSYQDFKLQMTERRPLPTAFVADDDTIAIGAIRALTENGYQVPEDISVVGFNNRPNCEIVTPSLTTIDVPKTSFGAEAVEALFRQIERTGSENNLLRSSKVRIGTQLIERHSVKQLI